MMPTGGGGNGRTANPYEQWDAPVDDDLMIEADDGIYAYITTSRHPLTRSEILDDDPLNSSDRAPLTGNISSQQANQNSRAANNAQGYLNSTIPGEDRRAPTDTLDESVWDTLRRDLLAVWEKMRQVLYPKYLLGGSMNAAEGETSAVGQIRGIVGRLDADTVLQGGMSEGLRDWDLWYVVTRTMLHCTKKQQLTCDEGDHFCSACFSLSCSVSMQETIKDRWYSVVSSQ
jgi:hypothetical protein